MEPRFAGRNPGTQEFLDSAWLHQGYTQASEVR